MLTPHAIQYLILIVFDFNSVTLRKKCSVSVIAITRENNYRITLMIFFIESPSFVVRISVRLIILFSQRTDNLFTPLSKSRVPDSLSFHEATTDAVANQQFLDIVDSPHPK